MIIGIAGKKQTGKDSMAGFIDKLLPDHRVKRISFAYPIKNFVHESFDIPKNHLYGSDQEKSYPLCTWGEIFTGAVLKKYGKKERSLLSAREIMQVVGTDVMREGNLNFLWPQYESKARHFLQKYFKTSNGFDSIWIDMAIMDIKAQKSNYDIVVVPDVRFHNERKAIAEAGGMNIRLYRDTGCDDSIPHSSELQLDEMEDSDFDYVLPEQDNNSLDALKRWTTNVLMQAGIIDVSGLSV